MSTKLTSSITRYVANWVSGGLETSSHPIISFQQSSSWWDVAWDAGWRLLTASATVITDTVYNSNKNAQVIITVIGVVATVIGPPKRKYYPNNLLPYYKDKETRNLPSQQPKPNPKNVNKLLAAGPKSSKNELPIDQNLRNTGPSQKKTKSQELENLLKPQNSATASARSEPKPSKNELLIYQNLRNTTVPSHLNTKSKELENLLKPQSSATASAPSGPPQPTPPSETFRTKTQLLLDVQSNKETPNQSQIESIPIIQNLTLEQLDEQYDSYFRRKNFEDCRDLIDNANSHQDATTRTKLEWSMNHCYLYLAENNPSSLISFCQDKLNNFPANNDDLKLSYIRFLIDGLFLTENYVQIFTEYDTYSRFIWDTSWLDNISALEKPRLERIKTEIYTLYLTACRCEKKCEEAYRDASDKIENALVPKTDTVKGVTPKVAFWAEMANICNELNKTDEAATFATQVFNTGAASLSEDLKASLYLCLAKKEFNDKNYNSAIINATTGLVIAKDQGLRTKLVTAQKQAFNPGMESEESSQQSSTPSSTTTPPQNPSSSISIKATKPATISNNAVGNLAKQFQTSSPNSPSTTVKKEATAIQNSPSSKPTTSNSSTLKNTKPTNTLNTTIPKKTSSTLTSTDIKPTNAPTNSVRNMALQFKNLSQNTPPSNKKDDNNSLNPISISSSSATSSSSSSKIQSTPVISQNIAAPIAKETDNISNSKLGGNTISELENLIAAFDENTDPEEAVNTLSLYKEKCLTKWNEINSDRYLVTDRIEILKKLALACTQKSEYFEEGHEEALEAIQHIQMALDLLTKNKNVLISENYGVTFKELHDQIIDSASIFPKNLCQYSFLATTELYKHFSTMLGKKKMVVEYAKKALAILNDHPNSFDSNAIAFWKPILEKTVDPLNQIRSKKTTQSDSDDE